MAWTFALNGGDSLTRVALNDGVGAVANDQTDRGDGVAGCARTTTESENSLFGSTVCVTRGVAAFALRTNTATGDAEPGWRSTSTALAVIVTRPRSGALIGIRATAENVMSRGLLVYT